ncbi:MAG: DUF3060 domain-containing protein [Mycobacterium sp.]
MPRHSPVVLLAALALLAGCGSDDGDRQTSEATDMINYGSFGTKADIDCAAGKSVKVGGSNNRLTVTGVCASVSVEGADNTITVERIEGELSVVGINNTIVYRHGDPAVSDDGSGNRISKG